MELFRDCLDKQVEDRNGRRMGRVDGVVFEFDGVSPPEVTAIEIGTATQADRLGQRPRRFLSWLTRGRLDEDRYRIPWTRIVLAGNTVIANVEAEQTPALALELWVRRKVIARIPGA